MHLSRDDPGAVGTFLKTFIFTLICTNWLLPTIFKIISSLLVVMGEEKRCLLDKKIEFKSSVVIQGHRILQESDKGQIFYWSIQTCSRIRLLFDCDHAQKTSKLPYFRLFRPDTQILSALTALYWPSNAFYWPSTTKYQPVPPFTDSVPSYITSNVRLSFVDLRWAQLYVSLVTYMSCLQRKWASFHQVALDLSACPWIVDRQQLVPVGRFMLTTTSWPVAAA